jgi:hypothetical protein
MFENRGKRGSALSLKGARGAPSAPNTTPRASANGEVMDKHHWVTSAKLVALLTGRRDNDVKVVLNGIFVPIADISYNSTADVFVIEMDEDCEDYRIATAPDPVD